jgi:hypothetical protein
MTFLSFAALVLFGVVVMIGLVYVLMRRWL